MASQLFTYHVSCFCHVGVCACPNEIRQVFMVSICTVNAQEQPSTRVFNMRKKKERGETAPPSGLRCQNPTEDDGEPYPDTLGG